jgi:hypothetical protein
MEFLTTKTLRTLVQLHEPSCVSVFPPAFYTTALVSAFSIS